MSEVFSNGGEFLRVPGTDFPNEEPTTENTTTEDTTTEDTTTEDTTTEDTTTENTTGTTVTMTTTRSTPPGRHPDIGDRFPAKEIAGMIIFALMGSAGIVIYKKIRK